jgi:hypothetical protein
MYTASVYRACTTFLRCSWPAPAQVQQTSLHLQRLLHPTLMHVLMNTEEQSTCAGYAEPVVGLACAAAVSRWPLGCGPGTAAADGRTDQVGQLLVSGP